MKLVKVSDIFDIEYGNQIDINKLKITENNNGINFISRQSSNLGVFCKVKKNDGLKLHQKGSITVALGGSILSSFIQEDKFYTAQNIKVFIPKIKMNNREKHFYCIAIMSNRYKYSSHGREANKTVDSLLVPSIDSIPNWVNNVILPKQPTKTPYQNKKVSLNDRKWGWFKLNDLFKISGTKTTKIKDLLERGYGKYPYITTQATDNGTEGFFNMYTENSNVLTIDSAVAGYCSYQANNFSASDHVEKLQPQFTMNQYIAIFLVTILNIDQYRFSYGRKASQTRMQTHKIRLPITNTGNPDWQFMEDYIKALPYSGNL